MEDLKSITSAETLAKAAAKTVVEIELKDVGHAVSYVPPLALTFSNLQRLVLRGCTLISIPWNIGQLKQLKELTISRACLSSAVTEIGELTSLASLDLSHNQITRVPDTLCNLTGLTALNLMGNQLESLPDAIGQLTNLRILGLKSNRLTSLPLSFTSLCSLVELFLTDNQLTTLPQGFGALNSLVKLQASFNAFTTLPDDILHLPRLELMRVASCRLASLPAAGLSGPRPAAAGAGGPAGSRSQPPIWPRLAWFSLSSNGACGEVPPPRSGLQQVGPGEVGLGPHLQLATPQAGAAPGRSIIVTPLAPTVGSGPSPAPGTSAVGSAGEKLGDGASGDVYRATLLPGGDPVAVKVFRSDVSPDGDTQEEVALALALDHPHLTRVRAVVVPPPAADSSPSSPSSSPHHLPGALVMDLVPGKPMAAKPTSQHLLRCKWAEGTRFTVDQVLTIAGGIASALAYLHSLHICHGDVYAHNILLDAETGHTTLCDFGAAFAYRPDEWFWEAMEVRAFGLFLKDLADRMEGAQAHSAAEGVRQVVGECVSEVPAGRPTFEQLTTRLRALQASS